LFIAIPKVRHQRHEFSRHKTAARSPHVAVKKRPFHPGMKSGKLTEEAPERNERGSRSFVTGILGPRPAFSSAEIRLAAPGSRRYSFRMESREPPANITDTLLTGSPPIRRGESILCSLERVRAVCPYLAIIPSSRTPFARKRRVPRAPGALRRTLPPVLPARRRPAQIRSAYREFRKRSSREVDASANGKLRRLGGGGRNFLIDV